MLLHGSAGVVRLAGLAGSCHMSQPGRALRPCAPDSGSAISASARYRVPRWALPTYLTLGRVRSRDRARGDLRGRLACSRTKRSRARTSILTLAAAKLRNRSSRRASSSGIDMPSAMSARSAASAFAVSSARRCRLWAGWLPPSCWPPASRSWSCSGAALSWPPSSACVSVVHGSDCWLMLGRWAGRNMPPC
jgi:hypothetical protein